MTATTRMQMTDGTTLAVIKGKAVKVSEIVRAAVQPDAELAAAYRSILREQVDADLILVDIVYQWDGAGPHTSWIEITANGVTIARSRSYPTRHVPDDASILDGLLERASAIIPDGATMMASTGNRLGLTFAEYIRSRDYLRAAK